MPDPPKPSAWPLMLGAAAILMITMGVRQSAGLFVLPLYADLELDYASISFAFAVGQLLWGAGQPVFGAMAERWGSRRILVLGALLLAAGLATTPLVTSEAGLLLTMGVLSAAGAGAGSFSVLIGATAGHVPAERRSLAGGFINAGGSFGQFVVAPLAQAVMSAFGWAAALLSLAGAALGHHPARLDAAAPTANTQSGTRRRKLGPAAPGRRRAAGPQLPLPARRLLHLRIPRGLLVTHPPGEVHLAGCSAAVSAASIGIIGLFNIAGSLCAGALGTRCRMKYILALMYGSRAVMIAIFLMAPHTEITFYVFAAALGFTWLATVPPTAGLVAKLFDTRYLATLFGLTLLTHQIGGFLGAWLGGLAMDHFGNYQWMWYTDIALAAAAALVNLPIREARVGVHAGV